MGLNIEPFKTKLRYYLSTRGGPEIIGATFLLLVFFMGLIIPAVNYPKICPACYPKYMALLALGIGASFLNAEGRANHLEARIELLEEARD